MVISGYWLLESSVHVRFFRWYFEWMESAWLTRVDLISTRRKRLIVAAYAYGCLGMIQKTVDTFCSQMVRKQRRPLCMHI